MSPNSPAAFSHASFHGHLGIARADITPPVGIYSRNWGAAEHDTASTIHRPLTLTALTLAATANGEPLVLLDADLGWWKTPHTFQQFFTRLLDALELKPHQLLFALSHTHAGPPLMEPDETLPGSELLKTWMEQLFEASVHVVREALRTAFPGTLDWQTGRCGLATMRDFPEPNTDSDRMVCGFNPDAKADDTLHVGRITDTDANLRATLVNYACHPTTLAWDNTAISPDYIGAMRDTMQQTTHVPALFLLGACGDLAPRYQYVGDTEVADRHGRQLAFAALATLEDMEPPGTELTYTGTVESGAPLAVWQHTKRVGSDALKAVTHEVSVPIKNWPTADELERERLACTDRALEERLRRKRDIRQGIGDGSTFALPIYAWRVGDAVIVGCCGEAYSYLQQELRTRFPQHTVICMNLLNGSIGYLPPADLYDVDVYPVWQTPFDRGSLELTLETMTQAIQHVLSD
ncbi:alkaline ceramidase [Thalassoroseus pseudoceratinae]|uniref:alkaline ceramidase n=1 Tax=Thalassoroseus pseudoceratinae TaxID=2713176 RepID=UPI001422237B|nr:alkaline ceramidase [Thalassoroseus pseudoceratinae]